MHAVEDRDAAVDVVVELDTVLALVGAEQPADVLHDSTFEREREGEEQGVELGPVEALAEVGAGGDEHDPVVGVPVGDGVGDGLAGSLAEPAAKHERVVAQAVESGDDGVDVLGALGEHQAGPTGGEHASWTSAQICAVRAGRRR